MRRTFWRILRVACLVIGGAASVTAQEFRATVTGRVADESGGAMPGVTVTVTNVETNEVAMSVTSGVGVYSVPFEATLVTGSL